MLKIIAYLGGLIAVTFLTSGCSGGAGESAGAGLLAGLFGGSSGSGGGTIPGIVAHHNPEPSSFVLLGSGLVGMAVYAKAKIKSKNKK